MLIKAPLKESSVFFDHYVDGIEAKIKNMFAGVNATVKSRRVGFGKNEDISVVESYVRQEITISFEKAFPVISFLKKQQLAKGAAATIFPENVNGAGVGVYSAWVAGFMDDKNDPVMDKIVLWVMENSFDKEEDAPFAGETICLATAHMHASIRKGRLVQTATVKDKLCLLLLKTDKNVFRNQKSGKAIQKQKGTFVHILAYLLKENLGGRSIEIPMSAHQQLLAKHKKLHKEHK